jgi:hypothetical protein
MRPIGRIYLVKIACGRDRLVSQKQDLAFRNARFGRSGHNNFPRQGRAFDLAIHSGDFADSTLIARRFAQTMVILVATPQYLARCGAPEPPDDLNRFRSVVFVERGSALPWSFGPTLRGFTDPSGLPRTDFRFEILL